ncbi:MAG: LamG domain-containing protein [Pseudomonadota bacterium]
MKAHARRTLAALFLAALAACPASTPALSGLDFECSGPEQCVGGFVCVHGTCVPASQVDAASPLDAGSPERVHGDGGLRDAVATDRATLDTTSPDGARADLVTLERSPQDGLATDQGAADSILVDSARVDAGVADVNAADARGLDALAVDGATVDAGAADQGPAEGGPGDSPPRDAAAADAAAPDVGAPDLAAPDTMTADSASPDAAGPDAGRVDAGPCQRLSLDFDGVDDRVTVPDSSLFEKLTSFTIEAWIYPRDLSQEVQIVSHHDHDTFKGWVLLVKDRYLELRVHDGSQMLHAWASDAVGQPQLVENAWQHVAGVSDGSELRIYSNGVLLHRVAASISETKDFGGPLRIGMAAYLDMFHFNGHIDEVQLSQGARYRGSFVPPAASFVPDSSTIALWRLDRNSGQQVLDEGPHGLHGVLGDSFSTEIVDPQLGIVACVPDRTTRPQSCAALFGRAPDYVLCQEDAQSCGFNVTTAGSNCDDWCQRLGSICLDAIDNLSGCELYVNDDDCSTNRGSEICVCSRP